ncbi:Hypothetical protein CINCED_3A016514 [Cinara cedri]|uniref:Uncharacterized protein n=1 Tax=Cinara cedri TaxID=506608 RepID=A0A5E4MNE8_9HEMI|nr:Hypothetical protein CINCED_3A016514 [Cinara cedri]
MDARQNDLPEYEWEAAGDGPATPSADNVLRLWIMAHDRDYGPAAGDPGIVYLNIPGRGAAEPNDAAGVPR